MPMTYSYHVFLSHSVDDKDGIANALDAALREKGLKIWYSGRDLKVGDPILPEINKGLRRCRFGVVILSPSFLDKYWGTYEMSILLGNSKGRKKVFPVLYNMTKEELAVRAPMISSLFAIDAAMGIPQVAEKIHDEIVRARPWIMPTRLVWRATISTLIMFMILGLVYRTYFLNPVPPDEIVKGFVLGRINKVNQSAEAQQTRLLQEATFTSASDADIRIAYSEFKNAPSYYRNEYELYTGLTTVRARKNVERVLTEDVENLSLTNRTRYVSSNTYQSLQKLESGRRYEQYFWRSAVPISYTVESEGASQDAYRVQVRYLNHLRLVYTSLLFPDSPQDTKRHHTTFVALPPVETYYFSQQEDGWVLARIE